MQAGNEAEAERLYEEVPRYGYGWATGMALNDRARRLLAQGKHKEAQQLLGQDIPGQYGDQVELTLRALLARSQYETDEVVQAEKTAKELLARFTDLGDQVLPGEGLEFCRNAAEAILQGTEKWREAPLEVVPRSAMVNAVVGQPVSLGFVVRTRLPEDLQSRGSDGAGIRLMWGTPVREGTGYARRITAVIAAPQKAGTSACTIRVEDPAGNTAEVAIRVSARPPVTVWPPRLLFVLRNSESAETQSRSGETRVQLSASTPFRVTAAAADSPALAISIVARVGDERATTHSLTVSLWDRAPARQEGILTIQTDLPEQQTVSIPYCLFRLGAE